MLLTNMHLFLFLKRKYSVEKLTKCKVKCLLELKIYIHINIQRVIYKYN